MALQLPQCVEGDVLNALKPYQKDLIEKLLADNDEEGAAKLWLSSNGPLNLQKFGGNGSGDNAFYERFASEFRKFICGDDAYANERAELEKISDPGLTIVIGTISAAVAGTLGIAVGLVVPAVALLLKLVVRLSVNAWCAV